ncbi:MAG: HAMP domain-containing sensor histidine kinase [Clostridia bacterium]|nr:HAMP domain-containing sensor histidine kinase [Clostridia bacterium]
MNPWLIFLSAGLFFAVLILSVKILLMKKSAKEIERSMKEKLENDTNTLISISSSDKDMKALASSLNSELRILREKRQKYVSGDAELKKAITNISHDLRTPLTAICGYLDLLEEENLSENGKRYLSVIGERTETMRLLTEELFRYSVITSKEEPLKPEEVSLNDVLEQSLAAFYGVFSARGITPEIRIPNCPVLRTLDKAALRRIFDNILSNAAKYSDGDLKVELFQNGTVSFSNSAKRLDKIKTERLFDRFYTVETASDSTGLGLSIAKLLTEKTGGTVSADYRDGRLFVAVKFAAKPE